MRSVLRWLVDNWVSAALIAILVTVVVITLLSLPDALQKQADAIDRYCRVRRDGTVSYADCITPIPPDAR